MSVINKKKTLVVVIGAGPAGLTASYELLKYGEFDVLILEKSDRIGGISCTINHNGNRMDIGGHRFFSKSQLIMDWWQNMIPFEEDAKGTTITYHNKETLISESPPEKCFSTDEIFLIRSRKSRIYFLKKFFDYPLKLSLATLKNLGFTNSLNCAAGYFLALIKKRHPESTLEDFLINRFGKPLYKMFFESYTFKVWGRHCSEINAEWGRQRIKGLSIYKAIVSAIKKPFKNKTLDQKNVETSLIEKFLYPKLGPGQLWEKCAQKVIENGGKIKMEHCVEKIIINNHCIVGVSSRHHEKEFFWEPDYVISSMPIRDIMRAVHPTAPVELLNISERLPYRDFLTIGILLPRSAMLQNSSTHTHDKLIQDNWIYIQDPNVKIGRLQIFNNWSPALVRDPESTIWLGLEYFCNETDDIWQQDDKILADFGLTELITIGLIEKNAKLLDYKVVRVPKAYPAYFDSYEDLPQLKNWFDQFSNLFLIGRNGMHRYNNQDHSMLSAMEAVNCIKSGSTDKSKIWRVNSEESYHESKS